MIHRLDAQVAVAPRAAARRRDQASPAAVPLLLRFAAYSLTLLAALVGMLGYLRQALPRNPEIFRESNFLEWVQFGTIALAALILFAGAWRLAHGRTVLFLAGCLASLACVREMDSLLDSLLPIGGWKLVAFVLVAVATVMAFRRRDELGRTLAYWVSSPAFGMLWAGFIMVVVFAQVFGRGELWQDIMGPGYDRTVKRAVEEICEWFGYCIILLGAVETVIHAGTRQRALVRHALAAATESSRPGGRPRRRHTNMTAN